MQSKVGILLTSLSIVFIFNLVTYAFRFGATIWVARSWGPAEYGKLALVMAIASMLFIPMAIGQHNAMYRWLPLEPSRKHGGIVLGTLITNVISVSLWAVLYWLAYPLLIEPLNIPLALWHVAIFVAVANNYQAISESFLRGKKHFLAIGQYKVISTVITVGLTVWILLQGIVDYKSMAYAFAAGILGFLVASLIKQIKDAKAQPINESISWALHQRFLVYGSFLMFNQLFTAILFDGDVILLNTLLSAEDLGLYAAYFGLVKQLFFIFFVEIFAVVFLPNIADVDRNKLFKRIQKQSPFLLIVVVMCVSVALWFVLTLFGDQYEKNAVYIGTTALAIGLFTLFQIYNHILTMDDKAGAQKGFLSILCVLPIYGAALPYLANKFQLQGAMVGMCLTYFSLFIVIQIFAFQHFKQSKKETLA